MSNEPIGLQPAEAQALRGLSYLGAYPANWVPPRDGIDHDVVIVGAGHTGLALALSLKRQGVDAVLLDAASEGEAAIWRGKARMNVLRTPKLLVGPELDIQALSFRYWYEARYGAQAYEALATIPRPDWADYLDWFRSLAGLSIRWQTQLTRLEGQGEHLLLHVMHDGKPDVLCARKVVLATGVVGGGGALLPEALIRPLDARRYAHTDDDIDFEHLRGRAVAVVGAAASAFDAAATALEAGAGSVDLFSRRRQLVASSGFKSAVQLMALDNFSTLPDVHRWRILQKVLDHGGNPPLSSIARLKPHSDKFRCWLDAPWLDTSMDGDGRVQVRSRQGEHSYDFVIFATGYQVDLSRRTELSGLADRVLLWQDRYSREFGPENPLIGRFPYLGPEYQLIARDPRQDAYLGNIHLFNQAAFASFGRPVGDMPSLGKGIPRLARRLVHDLFQADLEHHVAQVFAPAADDFGIAAYETLLAGSRHVGVESA